MRPPRRQRLRPHPPPSEISRARRGGRGLTRLTRRARAECGCRMPEPAGGRAREGRGRGPSPLLPASVPLAPSFRPAVLDLRLSGVYSIETTYLGACQLRPPWRSVNITQRQEPALPARRCTEGRRWRSCWCGGPVEMQTPVAGAHPSDRLVARHPRCRHTEVRLVRRLHRRFRSGLRTLPTAAPKRHLCKFGSGCDARGASVHRG